MRSIRQQLTRNLIGSLSALFGLSLAGIAIAAWLSLLHAFDSALRARALSVSALTEWEDRRVAFDFSEDFLRDFGAKHPRNFFQVWNAAGQTLQRSPSLRDAELPHLAPGSVAHPQYANVKLPSGRPGRALVFRFQPEAADRDKSAGAVPVVDLVVAVDREALNETLWSLVGAIAGCAILVLPAVSFIVPRVLRRGLAPVHELADRTMQIDANSLGTRLPVAALPMELQPIAGRLNDLLGRLEQSFTRERRFSADLAHELRTPLAELRSLAECALKWPDQRDAATDQETLAIAQQMQRIVEQILALARGEENQLQPELQDVDLAEAMAAAWRPRAVRAAERHLAVTWSVAPAAGKVDPGLLHSILLNLFGNAVDYVPVAGPVEIALRSAADRFILTTANPAPDLAPADVGQLFDRFWRKEAARSGGHHLGLGLALAAAFARAMQCTLTARMDERGWLVFTLEGPAGFLRRG